MKKFLASFFAVTMMLGFASVITAGADPGENNKKGLCTAYFNGQKNGHDDGSPGPFADLEDAADEEDGEDADNPDAFEVAADVFEYCQDYGIGGNPTNGRWDCSYDEENEVYSCEDGGGPGAEGKGKNK